jgi:hypothetical protein
MELTHASRGPSPALMDAVSLEAPAAVAEPVLDLVAGPLQPATVLGVHAAAVVLCCDTGEDTGEPARALTVLTADASGVPNGIRTAWRAADRPFSHIATGDPAFVGAGGVRLARLRLRAVRTVRTAVPAVRLRPGMATAVATVAETAGAAARGVPDRPVDALRVALAAGDPALLRAAVHALVGLGAGSTPGGDDVLAGALAALHATRRSVLAHQVGVAALADVATRTTALSADLLRLAAAGHVCSEAAAVLRAVDSGDPSALREALRRLLRVGHTSGADLATGLALGLATPAQPIPPHPRQRAVTGHRR